MEASSSLLVGLLGLAILFVFLTVVSGKRPGELILGTDGTFSTSMFQFLLWTSVVIFSYLVMFCFHARDANFAALNFSKNLLLVTSFSSITTVAAKGIAVNQSNAAAAATLAAAAQGILAPPKAPSKAGILKTDDGTLDLGKVQLIAWTVIGACIYLATLHHNLAIDQRVLPDIDQNLMVLMGLGNGTYLGKKAAGNGGS